jgi:hypothetical protein
MASSAIVTIIAEHLGEVKIAELLVRHLTSEYAAREADLTVLTEELNAALTVAGENDVGLIAAKGEAKEFKAALSTAEEKIAVLEVAAGEKDAGLIAAKGEAEELKAELSTAEEKIAFLEDTVMKGKEEKETILLVELIEAKDTIAALQLKLTESECEYKLEVGILNDLLLMQHHALLSLFTKGAI